MNIHNCMNLIIIHIVSESECIIISLHGWFISSSTWKPVLQLPALHLGMHILKGYRSGSRTSLRGWQRWHRHGRCCRTSWVERSDGALLTLFQGPSVAPENAQCTLYIVFVRSTRSNKSIADCDGGNHGVNIIQRNQQNRRAEIKCKEANSKPFKTKTNVYRSQFIVHG